MGKYVILNGAILPKEQAFLRVDNRGTLYGDGLFETMRCKGVIPPFFNLHWQRLSAGLHFLKMDYSMSFSKETLLQSIQRLLTKEKLFFGSSVRINCIRKTGGKYTPTQNGIDYFIEAFPLENDEFALNKEGLNIGLFDAVPKPVSPLSAFKNSNATPMVLAGIEAREMNWDECLLYNTNGHLCESISSNVFFKVGNEIATPSLAAGCVDGTVRKLLLDIIPKAGYRFFEIDNIHDEILNTAEEVFLTNAVAGIKWVSGFGRKRYFYKTSQILMDALNREFNAMHIEMSQ